MSSIEYTHVSLMRDRTAHALIIGFALSLAHFNCPAQAHPHPEPEVVLGAQFALPPPFIDHPLIPLLPELSEPSAHRAPCQKELNPRDFRFAFQQAIPSVVSIASGHEDPKGKFTVLRVGSGVIWGDQKFILTNAHVIKGGRVLRARTYEQRVVRLSLIGVYERLDIALMKIESKEGSGQLPAIKISECPIRPGEWVGAIGHPYNMPYSLSTGAVSALYRSESLGDWKGAFPGFIQTDLTLNPGNSGGPLVNLRGEMLGMNTAIMGMGQGLSFALPLSRLQTVIERLLSSGQFERSYVGVHLKRVSHMRSQRAGIPIRRGVRVSQVVSHSPADHAGLQRNDIILALNDQEMNHPGELSWALISSPAGASVTIEVVRVFAKGPPETLSLQLTPSTPPHEHEGPPSPESAHLSP